MNLSNKSRHIAPGTYGISGTIYPAIFYHLISIPPYASEARFFHNPREGEHNMPWLREASLFHFPREQAFLVKNIRLKVDGEDPQRGESLRGARLQIRIMNHESPFVCDLRIMDWMGGGVELPVSVVLNELVNFDVAVKGIKPYVGSNESKVVVLLIGAHTIYE